MELFPAPARYRKRSDAISLVVVISHLGFALAPALLAALHPSGLELFLLWLWLGLAMSGLLNLMHECAHFHVFRERWASNVLGRWVLGPLFFADFDGYRKRHWDHHRKLGLPDDSKVTYKVDVQRWRFVSLLLRCLVLIEALKRFRHQTRPGNRDASSRPAAGLWVVRTLLTQGLLFSSLLALAMMSRDGKRFEGLLAAVLAYGGVYLYGVMSLTVFAATLRAIAEHQHGKDAAVEVGAAVLRNFTRSPFSQLVFGAYGFSEHATHHLEPGIPCYELKAATARLSAADPAFAPRAGYLKTLLRLVRRGDGAASEDPSNPIPANRPVPAEPQKGRATNMARAIDRKALR
jgi:fatty acid desaturase